MLQYVFFIQSFSEADLKYYIFCVNQRPKNNEYLSIFPHLCFGRKLTQKPLFASPQSETFLNVTVSTQGIFILKHNLASDCSLISCCCWMEALCGADLTQLVSARVIFPLSAGAWSVLSSAQPKPHGALTNLSSPSVFHVAWGTLAGSPNEPALLPPWPPPVIVSSPCATYLSHRGLLMAAGYMDFAPHLDHKIFFHCNVQYLSKTCTSQSS